MKMSNITFEVAKSNSCVFQKVLSAVDQASKLVSQHYISIGPIYRVIRVVAFLATGGAKRHPHSSPSKHGSITQCCFNVGQASKTLGPTLKQYWVNGTCLLGCCC